MLDQNEIRMSVKAQTTELDTSKSLICYFHVDSSWFFCFVLVFVGWFLLEGDWEQLNNCCIKPLLFPPLFLS